MGTLTTCAAKGLLTHITFKGYVLFHHLCSNPLYPTAGTFHTALLPGDGFAPVPFLCVSSEPNLCFVKRTFVGTLKSRFLWKLVFIPVTSFEQCLFTENG